MTNDKTLPTATDAQGVGEAPKAVADDSQYFWLVELFHRGDTGNSLGRYHTGFIDLSRRSRSTENVYEAKRYADKATAERVAASLMESPSLVSLEWRAVEHGFMSARPTASTTAGLTEAARDVITARDNYGWSTEVDEKIEALRVRLDGGAAK